MVETEEKKVAEEILEFEVMDQPVTLGKRSHREFDTAEMKRSLSLLPTAAMYEKSFMHKD